MKNVFARFTCCLYQVFCLCHSSHACFCNCRSLLIPRSGHVRFLSLAASNSFSHRSVSHRRFPNQRTTSWKTTNPTLGSCHGQGQATHQRYQSSQGGLPHGTVECCPCFLHNQSLWKRSCTNHQPACCPNLCIRCLYDFICIYMFFLASYLHIHTQYRFSVRCIFLQFCLSLGEPLSPPGRTPR